ncbi:MAG: hypothetical protein ACREPD_04075 [Stenotrophomonas sp.]|uniref:hypothetical protein n=1 Tax=Stenotrophomonas sp. TaxID=69392 RepID=UPI003D6C9625
MDATVAGQIQIQHESNGQRKQQYQQGGGGTLAHPFVTQQPGGKQREQEQHP